MKKLLSIAVLFMFLFTACDKCSDVECLNGGSCDKGECACPFEWEGDKCETKTLTKHMGMHNMNVQVTSFFNEDFEVSVFIDSSNPKKFYIGGSEDGVYGILTSRTGFSLPSQTVLVPDFDDPDNMLEFTGSGSGSFTANGFTAEMNIESTPPFTMVITAIKQ